MKSGRTRADWFHEAKWGVLMHFLAAPPSSGGGAEVDAEEWNRRVDAFDVQGLAGQLAEVRAGYFMITLGQNSGHYCAPNATYDRLTGIRPSKCASRDLVAELHDALAPSGIRLILYLPSGAPEFDPVAVDRLAWAKGGRCEEFQRKWEAVIREWSLRWGRKVAGWWFDGCYYNDVMYRTPEEPNFKSFAAAARSGNPDSIIGWNPGVTNPPYTVDEEEDYTAGEINEPQLVDSPGRWDRHAQFHVLSFLGNFWARPPLRFTAAEAIAHTLAFTNHGGVFTWDAPLTHEGLIQPEAFDVLKEVGRAVDATRGEADTPPPKAPKVSLAFTRIPVSRADGAEAVGRFKVSLRNASDEPLRGEAGLSAGPEGAVRLVEDGRVAYDLAPGAEMGREVSFALAGATKANAGARIVLARQGGLRPLVFKLPSRERIVLPRIQQPPGVEAVPEAMEAIPPRPIITATGRNLAEVKLAVTGGHLALFCRVGDQALRHTPSVWDGSCMELFGVAEAGGRINQLFLVPAAAGAPARALWLAPSVGCSDVTIVPAPDIVFATWPRAGGYTSAALIPLAWWLNLAAQPERLLLEIAVSAGDDASSFCRAALFGNLDAACRSDGYALAIIG